jgi:hypothetical protein
MKRNPLFLPFWKLEISTYETRWPKGFGRYPKRN